MRKNNNNDKLLTWLTQDVWHSAARGPGRDNWNHDEAEQAQSEDHYDSIDMTVIDVTGVYTRPHAITKISHRCERRVDSSFWLIAECFEINHNDTRDMT